MTELEWKIIDSLSRTLNMTKTAEQLFMTQPSISKKLRQIETELGVQIVKRHHNGISLTSEGEYIARQAHELIQKFAEIRTELMRMKDGTSGVLKLGATNAFAGFILPELLKQYKQLYPDIQFEISIHHSTDILAALHQNRIHIGFIRGDVGQDVEHFLFSEDQAYAAYPSEITLEQLPQLPQIQYLTDPSAIKRVRQWWNEHFSVPPLMGMHANHGDTCRKMVLSGLGYGIFLSPDFIDQEDRLFKLPLFHKDGRPFTRKSWVVIPKGSYSIPTIRNFMDYMGAACRQPSL
jgi:DNA-binding transcriptional LysR family regulator